MSRERPQQTYEVRIVLKLDVRATSYKAAEKRALDIVTRQGLTPTDVEVARVCSRMREEG